MEQISQAQLPLKINMAQREVLVGKQTLPLFIAKVIKNKTTTMDLITETNIILTPRFDNPIYTGNVLSSETDCLIYELSKLPHKIIYRLNS